MLWQLCCWPFSVVTSGGRPILGEKQHETTHCNRGLLLTVIGGYLWWQGARRIHPLRHGNVDIRDANLAFRVGGRVDQVLVDEGIA